jgi:tetratricopeptide (TPR) repeat protein
MPKFVLQSKSKDIAYSENLQKIFRVYLMDNEYEELLSIIDSYEKLNIQAKNDMVINSYKAFAKWRIGDTDEALSLYKKLVIEYHNEDDIMNLGKMFFNTGDAERGYQIFELITLARFASDTLLNLAYRMADHRICRTEKGLENTRIGKHFAKKAIVPILFKAIEFSANEDTIREVKRVLQGIGGRDEFDFIQKHNHVPQEMFNILSDERGKAYDWSSLKYLEANKLDQKNISGINELLHELIINIIQPEITSETEV